MPVTLQQLLLKCQHIFFVLKGLPPSRNCDLRIELIPNAQPVKVKPYRYPHGQKFEIELQVKNIMAEGLIKHSMSPFSSPVLLVKKKERGHGIFAHIIGL